jgi:hypothetical protein
MANDSDPESIAELLQALDDVREAARRVEQERNLAVDRPERPPARGSRTASKGRATNASRRTERSTSNSHPRTPNDAFHLSLIGSIPNRCASWLNRGR